MSAAGQSWGRYPRPAQQALLPLAHAGDPLPAFEGTALPRGNGRSYGDSCLNPGGSLLQARGLDHFIHFDPDTGVLECEGGVLLAEILALAVPRGWFLPVTPGTQFVTVGGAIANDVHGKNHHVAGSFGDHVLGLELLRSDGSRRECGPGRDPDWFRATVGGLGLTGLVTRARVQLRRIPGAWIDSESIRFGALPEFFELSAASAASHEYTVAWVDCLARGASLGRGHFSRGNHAGPPAGASEPKPPRVLGFPLTPPVSLVNGLSLRLFNQAYYHRQRQRAVRRVGHYQPFFYPLDGLRDWNRMYGPRGFLQYQCVVPPAHAADAIAELLRSVSASGTGSFLAVLKQFGDRPGAGLLSFARPGTTLALDFPNSGAPVLALLERLDQITEAAGGAVYPAKDARWPGQRFRRANPAWEPFSAFVDPRFSSGFWRRAME